MRFFFYAKVLAGIATVGFAAGGCSAVQTTAGMVSTAGKVGWGAAKVTGKVAKVAGKATWETGRISGNALQTVIEIPTGTTRVPLHRQGNSLYADVLLNRRHSGRFLVDTGASSVQISRRMARSLGINLARAEQVPVTLAGGYTVSAKVVTIREMKVGRARIKNVRAIVMEDDSLDTSDGLLGMSFLNNFTFHMDPSEGQLTLKKK